ncbi:hypothetical protein OG372_00160 [Streptomyces sp. NBC_01020]|uniref:hypothetical protein n=1 Tax=Streptomyces sp. NBC_01020 TaxID=2903722 RepID=UPI00386FE4EE|nr:hypothetical protein OG372_00160 [Streptomyces sp. NBC_01020]
MHDNTWFDHETLQECDDDPFEFTETELGFLAALRARAATWRVPWAPSGVSRPEDDSSLLVWIALHDEQRPLVLGEWAVHFYGTYLQAGKTSDDLFNLHQTPERGFFSASGTPDELALRCADWFEGVLRRPVVRSEWPAGRRVLGSWEFADTGEGLATSFAVSANTPPPARCVQIRPWATRLPSSP